MSKDILEGTNIPDLNKESLNEIKKNLTTTIETIAIFAKLTKVKYDALIQNGFTEAQALILCQKLF